MQIPRNSQKQIALWGGDGLWIKSNNPTVVPPIIGDGINLPTSGNLKIIPLKGADFGTAMITAGTGGSAWVTLQVQVVGSDGKLPTTNFTLDLGGTKVAALPEQLFKTFVDNFIAGAGSAQHAQLHTNS